MYSKSVMPKPLHIISSILLSSFLILLFACGKEAPAPTVINGKVTDKKSGLPIEGVVINIDFQQMSGLLVTKHEYKQFTTDQQGEFHYTHHSDYDGTYSDVGKGGYVTQSPLGIKRGEVNNLKIQLVPKDGTLRLELINDTGQFDAIYVVLRNPSYGSLYAINLPQFPVVLPVGEKYTTYFDLPSEEFSQIYWGFTYFPGSSAAPFRDSVYLALHDTTSFTISF
jgi:hypothetical protein